MRDPLHIAAQSAYNGAASDTKNWRITTVCGKTIPAFDFEHKSMWTGVLEEYLENTLKEQGRPVCEACANHPLRYIYALNWTEL